MNKLKNIKTKNIKEYELSVKEILKSIQVEGHIRDIKLETVYEPNWGFIKDYKLIVELEELESNE